MYKGAADQVEKFYITDSSIGELEHRMAHVTSTLFMHINLCYKRDGLRLCTTTPDVAKYPLSTVRDKQNVKKQNSDYKCIAFLLNKLQINKTKFMM